MTFIIGFLIWTAFGVVAGVVGHGMLRAPGTARGLSLFFAIAGAFIGGMLGTSAYIFHEPVPTRVGGLIGAAAGAIFFIYIYHFSARRLV